MLIKRTPFDLIVEAYKNDSIEKLHDKLKEELLRWSMADDLIRNWRDTKTIIGILTDKFEISQATAYRDISNAKRLYGTVRITDKNYYKDVYAEQLEEDARICRIKGDHKSAVIAMKEAAEIRGLKDSDEAANLYADLEPSKFILIINVQQSEGSRAIEIDFDNLQDVEDIDFTEVSSTLNAAPSVSQAQMQKLLNERR